MVARAPIQGERPPSPCDRLRRASRDFERISATAPLDSRPIMDLTRGILRRLTGDVLELADSVHVSYVASEADALTFVAHLHARVSDPDDQVTYGDFAEYQVWIGSAIRVTQEGHRCIGPAEPSAQGASVPRRRIVTERISPTLADDAVPRRGGRRSDD